MRLLSLTVVLVLLVAPLVAQKNPTDDEITDQVLVKLASDADLGGIKFEVTVHQGAVTLKGKVRNEKTRIQRSRLKK